MDFDTAKENIQPLASGRNAEQLETALHAESDHEIQEKLHEQRRDYEKAIETYEGDDPLQPWYDYIVWVEQIYPKSGKESALHELLSKCLAFFEKDERYFQDRRMLKLYIKYIDSEPNPPQFYEQLYNSGIGTMIADLYLCWAHYYDYCDNFEKAEAVYRKGLDARAQPIELLEQAHRQFGFSMSQRILYKDESTQREFRSTMDEQRLALTSLRAHKHRHVGSIRTGSAVKSHNPGRVSQHGSSSRQKQNRKVEVFEDDGGAEAPTSPIASTSVVQSIINSTKKQENMREPGPWNKAKIKSHALFTGGSSSKPSFSILEDDDIPLPDSENNYARGIQLPKDFVRKNLPQEEFAFPLHRDEDPVKNTLYKYDKFMVFPAPDKCYSLEELSAYKWFKKRNIKNNFTRTQDAVWANGYNVPIRIPPHFVCKNRKQDDWAMSPISHEDALANGQRKFGFNIDLIYTPYEEFSPEEILQSKWINGDLMSQKDADMDITCGFDRREDIYIRNAKRRSMALGGRKSILPRRSDSPRKSIAGARISITPTEPSPPEAVALQQQEKPKEQQQEATTSTAAEVATGAVKRTSLPKRKSVYISRAVEALTTIPETTSPPISRRRLNEDEEMSEIHDKPNPVKFSIFEDNERKETENDDNIFKVPQSIQKPGTASVFQDEDLDGCTTQTFNFFIKSQSISTPKVAKPSAKLAEPERIMAKGLDFGSDSDASPGDERNDGTDKQPFGLRCADIDQQYALVEQQEIYRQKLSAIMETTEECATASTVSSLAATASSKSSSVEDFDFTKHSNQQSSVAMSMYRQHTVINSTTKMSSSNVSGMHRENESRKASALGFEIYQEEVPKANDTMVSQAPVNVTKNADLSKPFIVQPDNFDKTLPPAGQFHIYEDEAEEETQTTEIQPPKKEISIKEPLVKEAEVSKCPDRSVFDISHAETAPSNWSSKTLTNDTSSTRRVSTVPTTENQQDFTLTTQMIPSKPTFQMMREDTGLTLPMINFVEERTEQIPSFFNGNQTDFTQPAQPAFDAPSIYMPQIPNDTMKNTSNMFRADASLVETPPSPPAIDQSAMYNKSVFIFPNEDTITNVFTTNFTQEKTGTALNLPNPLQVSMITGNLSAFPMIPEMPTLPEIDFAAEASRNASIIDKSQAVNQTKAETTHKIDKSIADQSLFYGFREDTDLTGKQGNMAANKSTVGRKTLVESRANDVSKVNISEQIDKTLSAPSIVESNEAQNKSVFVLQDEEKENQQTDNVPAKSFIGNKSMANKSKAIVDDELYAMINSPPKQAQAEQPPSPVAENSPFCKKSFVLEKMEKSRTAIDDEIYAIISPTSHISPEVETGATGDCNKSVFSKSKPNIDDEFYAMIKSPITLKDNTLPTPVILDISPSPLAPPPIRESIAPERKTVHQISLLRNPSMSLLEPIKQISTRESLTHDIRNVPSIRRNSSVEITRAFSEDNPNTAMFSLHMPSIKNSTILHGSKDNVSEITDELKTSLVINTEKLMGSIPEKSMEQPETKRPNVTADEKLIPDELAANITTDLKANSIHIKEERLSIPNKTVVSEKPPINIDEEIYECIKESDSVVNGFLDLSIELTEAEMLELGSKTECAPKPISNFVIGNPVSIRPSQFPMNQTNFDDTIAKDEVQELEKPTTEFQQSSSKNETTGAVKPEDTSLIVVEDTEDLSAVCKLAVNRSRRETVHSPFKNRYATNPKLNETISAVKEDIDPFDIHLQNAFLDDIDFIEYIRSLDYVNITTRVGAIELNTQLQMGNETFDIVQQIGKGSFGFVYSGKNTKTGKMYAFKQERPANHWEFYISLEISSRIEDPKLLPGFMSVDYAMVGHNSSIFASELCEYGSLFNVCNHHKSNTCRNLDEVIVMILSEQMLSILDHLHASNIIHGDIKPDNFLLMRRLTYGCNDLVIKLIDYGRSIDLNFFPPNQTFTSTLNTKNFICTEMLENRPWKHQVDLFCMASTMYTLVCGKYMNVQKNDSLIRPYVLSEKLPSYLDVALWEHVFYTLINVRDHNALPDLQKLRLQIRESIAEKESILQDRIAKFNSVLDNRF